MEQLSEKQEALKWLCQIGTPGFEIYAHKPGCWTCAYTGIGVSTTQQVPSIQKICVECGYQHIDADQQTLASTQARDMYQIYRAALRIAEDNSDVGPYTHPMLHGLLVHQVTDALKIELAALDGIPELEYAKTLVADELQNVSTKYPYVYEAALAEAEMLGAKAVTAQTINNDQCRVQIGVHYDSCKYILHMWLGDMETDNDVKKATSKVRGAKVYRDLVAIWPAMAGWLDHWEQTLTDALKFRKNKMFYATRVCGGMWRTSQPRAYMAVIQSGLKAQREHSGLGELPELAVEWLKSKTDHIDWACAEGKQQNLSQEQLETALNLWHEAEPYTIYFGLTEAIAAGARL